MCMPSLLEVDNIGAYTVHSRYVTVYTYTCDCKNCVSGHRCS